jgi:DNA-binding LytR/AlgR family response regulator
VKPEWVIVLTGVFILLVNFSVRAVKRVRREALSFPLHTVPKPKEVESIRFKTDYKTVTVALKDIRYVESMSEYVKIYLDSQPDPLVVLYSLKRLSAELPAGRFMRIHRSYIVALDRIRESSATLVVLEGDVALPVSATYREDLRSFLSRK